MINNDSIREIHKLHLHVKILQAKGYSEEQIIEEMQKQGLEKYYIETLIQNIENENSDKKSFRNSMIMGTFYIVSGTLINIFSYRIAENVNASFFYIFWGIIAVGILTIVRGFILYRK